MDKYEFQTISKDLQDLRNKIPLNWGAIQNNREDDKIKMFSISSYEELEEKLSTLSEYSKSYLRRRWYLWKCSQCDEYLFYVNSNVMQNPDRYDKEWDVKINEKYYFDIKGTVVPKNMRSDVLDLMENPERMIDFYYDEQSKERRYDIQNRLFIVHHSFVSHEREMYLRSAWMSKRSIYKEFCDNIDRIRFYKTHNVTAGVIFVLEKEKGKVEYKICGL